MAIFSATAKRLAAWYQGKYIPPLPNDPDSSVFFISPGYYEQPFLAKFIGIAWGFYIRHWQWFWTTAIAAVSAYAAVLQLACK